MNIVVICKNQSEYISHFIDVLSGHNIVFVLDRCEDDSFNFRFPSNVSVIKNTNGTGFLAGKMRDIGASLYGKNDDILFLDGDKIPLGDITYIPKMGYDCVLLGTGNNEKRMWMYNNTTTDYYRAFRELYNKHWEKVKHQEFPYEFLHNDIYSCGIWLSSDSIKLCKEVNNGRIFREDFDGVWGEEDRFVGDILINNNYKIGFNNKIILNGKYSWVDISEIIQNGSSDGMDKSIYQFSTNFLKRIKLIEKYFIGFRERKPLGITAQ